MPATQVRTAQIGDGTVSRADLNTTVSGSAVIAKAAQGAGMALTSTGADAGTGDVTFALANLSANTLLGNPTSGVAAPSEFAVGANTLVGRGAIGNITAITVTSPITITGTSITLNVGVDHNFTTAQTMLLTNTNVGTDDTVLRLRHNLSSGTPGSGCGTCIWFNCQSNNVADRDQGQIFTAWSVATDASRASYMGFRTVTAATMSEKMRLWGSGGLEVGSVGSDPGSGVIEASTGFKIGANEFPVASNGLVRRTGANAYAAISSLAFFNVTTAAQSIGATDTYLTASRIQVSTTDWAAGMLYHVVLHVSKTAAGTGTLTITFRAGTNGSISDASCAVAIQPGTQTAVADTALIDLYFIITSTGISATGTTLAILTHNVANGLFPLGANLTVVGTLNAGGSFNTTTATNIGLSYNGGTGAVTHTVTVVKAELVKP